MAKPTIADVMREYANGAVAFVRRTRGVDLDYSEQSLEEIDAVIAERTSSALIAPDELPAAEREEFWTYCKVLGGYVGEVILRNLGGSWEMQDTSEGAANVSLVVQGVRGSPPEAVWRAHTEQFKAITSYYRTLKVALGQGERVVEESGLTTVKLPPLSTEAPRAALPAKRSVWWKFWRS